MDSGIRGDCVLANNAKKMLESEARTEAGKIYVD